MIKGSPKTPPVEIEIKSDLASLKEERLARALRENLKRRKASKENAPEGGDEP